MSETSKKLTASVVGGGVGGRLSMRALAASDHFDLVAAADLRPEVCQALEDEFPGLRTYLSHEDLFTSAPTDVVCVSTYPPSHEAVAVAALQTPVRGILVEKPLGHTYASGQRVLEAIKSRKLPMAVPHGLLARRAPLEILERVRGGEIGELKLVEIQCSGWDIINAGIHWLNFVVTLIGNEPMKYVLAACDASTRTYRDGMQVETVAVTYAESRSGVRVVMQTGDYIEVNSACKETLFRLIGTAGQIEFYGWHPSYSILNAEYPDGETITPEEFAVTGHQRHLDHLAEMIASGKPGYSIPESSLSALQLCEGAYLSSAHGCQVSFPLEEFSPPAPSDWLPGQPYSGTGGGRDGRKL
ncbi:MAG: Gfo/Idh/MocA family oxidoreductase [Chloroflexota bacterium]|nr:Gfo/Idh/MocA family oxidoreductase [Chloroflexota bacterium]